MDVRIVGVIISLIVGCLLGYLIIRHGDLMNG